MPIKPYLQLVRLPNVFTAAADSLSGWLLATGGFAEPARWLPTAGASMAIYAAGIAFNDVFDYAIDLDERPGRPLPSGRVSRRFAAAFGVALMALGLALSAVAGPRAAVVASILAVAVLAYDGGLKRTVLGPEVMGSCRALNVALGLAGSADFGGPWAWGVAASLGLFVVGITWISRSETLTGERRGPIAGAILQAIALSGLVAATFRGSEFPEPTANRPIVPIVGLAVLALVAAIVGRADLRAILDPNPGRLQGAVKSGVLALVWLNVGIVAAVRGPAPALAVATLWVPAYLLGKWLYST